jgi:ethanolamine ammonia-lyase large subunit
MRISRRTFVSGLAIGAPALGRGAAARPAPPQVAPSPGGVSIARGDPGDDLFRHIQRRRGRFDLRLYRQLLGAANEFKEGDAAQGIAAADDASRQNARALLARTRIGDLMAHPVFEDTVFTFIERVVDPEARRAVAAWTMGELKTFLLERSEPEIKRVMPGLSSDVIACSVKLMTGEELIAVGRKVFNPLPGSSIGARGYLGARIQPNSPTDHVDDIQWQVFDGWSYAVGDVLLGTNPVSSEVESVASVQHALAEIIRAFDLEGVLPHCVLAHVDVQAEVERRQPGSTALWFQSLAGVTDANATFDITVEKMVAHAAARTGRFGLYFETGQGADATNGHGKGFDMVMHEARKYGFARALAREVANARARAGAIDPAPWVHVNDVAGFIGPEVFRKREQLVRCCLEDTVMGKLHGLTIGLDVCSTLHMDVDLDDLDWCLDRIMPASPAYLMALPTKNDPMLSYLTTGFQDHVRLRETFGYRVDDRMWSLFQSLGVIDRDGKPTEHFGQPTWVYLQYRRRRGDARSDAEILAEGRAKMAEVRARGVFIAEGYGARPSDLDPALDERLRFLYADARRSIWAELPAGFADTLPAGVTLASRSQDRTDYVLHPPTGEQLDEASAARVDRLAQAQRGRYDVQIVVSDGLNVFALTDEGHLEPYLTAVRAALARSAYTVAPEHLVVTNGRVRIGYRIGERLFGGLPDRESRRAILHVIGERPGSGHHAFSVYLTAPPASTWASAGLADHNITRVVSGIADTALAPAQAAVDTVGILQQMAERTQG